MKTYNIILALIILFLLSIFVVKCARFQEFRYYNFQLFNYAKMQQYEAPKQDKQPPKVERVVVYPHTRTGQRNQTLSFSAGVVFAEYSAELGNSRERGNYYPQAVTWSLSGSPKGESTIKNGKVSIGKLETADTLVVIATAQVDNTTIGKAYVIVADHLPVKSGQGGGFIFYDKGEYTNGWRYLEAAPAESEFGAKWGLHRYNLPETSTRLGDGKANTALLIKHLQENGEVGKAAQLCDALYINGYTDWFLPSKDELNEMYNVLWHNENVGGFSGIGRYQYWYWSSSGSGYSTWRQNFLDGEQTAGGYVYAGLEMFNDRERVLAVRAVRRY